MQSKPNHQVLHVTNELEQTGLYNYNNDFSV